PTWTATICENRGSGVRGQGSGGTGLIPPFRCSLFYFLPAPDPRPPIPSPGFTLLELSLVLFIIGLLVTVIVPRLGDLDDTRLEASARRLAALARYLNGEAAFRSQLYRLNYDLDKRAYWVSVLTPHQNAPEFIIDTSLLARPVQLPPSITFVDIHVPSAGHVSTGQVYTHFYPQGYTDPTTIHLRDQHSRVVTVTIPPLPAEVGVSEGYVDGFVSR
ncbi:MAG: prepilin-type N-terminal cleavage/methylation domain-containing protein, partial [Deltaproteobacteria bacterium]|nr:prepilin-type N-terminal cleavage/methylation domain-containing protein [Deltaproteobacteria bacterium]